MHLDSYDIPGFSNQLKVRHYIDIVWTIHQLFPLIYPVSIYIEKYNCEVGRFLKNTFIQTFFLHSVEIGQLK